METVKALKRYGQNFLKNKSVLENIATLVEVTDKDLIIEIGPGMGALTEYLSKKESKLLCYEIDTRMKDYLQVFVLKLANHFLNAATSSSVKCRHLPKGSLPRSRKSSATRRSLVTVIPAAWHILRTCRFLPS